MSVDASAVARVTGIGTQFKNLKSGSARFTPQRIVVLAQGCSDVVYSTAKRQVTSEPETGNTYGYGCPADLIVDQLFPANGDGVDSIPVTLYPLVDDPAGVAANGTITPVGTTMSDAGAYRARVNGILGNSFVIPSGAVSLTDVCGLVGSSISAVMRMPVDISYTYGAVTASAITGTGNGTLTALTAPGTPTPGAYKLTCNTHVANGGVWTLTDPSGSVIANDLTMTVGVGAASVFDSGGLQFTVTDGTTDFEVGDQFMITVPATDVKATAKWKGSSGNGIYIEIIGDTTLGVTFTIAQPSGGLVNPDVTDALAQIGNVWETLIINAMELTDATTLDAIMNVGEGRWGDLVRKPFVAFTGNTSTDRATVTAITDARKTDRVNSVIPGVGSVNLPFVVAARAVAMIAKQANDNPPTDYGAQPLTGIIPGNDGDQWDYPTRNAAVMAGSSTIEVVDSVVQLSDVITFYHPTGDPNPAYRYVVDIVRLMTCIYSIDTTFSAKEWAAAPLIPDGQATVNANARHPSDAKARLAGIADSLGDEAIISDPDTAKKSITSVINSENPKRLDMTMTVQLSGNTNIKSATLYFGFFFGAAA